MLKDAVLRAPAQGRILLLCVLWVVFWDIRTRAPQGTCSRQQLAAVTQYMSPLLRVQVLDSKRKQPVSWISGALSSCEVAGKRGRRQKDCCSDLGLCACHRKSLSSEAALL